MEQTPPEAVHAIALALYALHDVLVEKGVLEANETAARLRLFGPKEPSDAEAFAPLLAQIKQVAGHLERGIFRAPDPTRPITLQVIDGGKTDE